MRDEGSGVFGFRISDFVILLHSCRQLAQREEAAAGGLDFVGAWPLEDDLGPAVVGDFHQAGGEVILAAQGDGRGGRGGLRIGPAAIGHARDPADKLRLRHGSATASAGPASCTGMDACADRQGTPCTAKRPGSPCP